MPVTITPDSAVFDTWREYVEYGTKNIRTGKGHFPENVYGNESIQTTEIVGGTHTIEEAIERAYSWPEGADMLAEMTAKIERENTLLPSSMRKSKVILQDKRPGPIHMGRLIAGHPSHMAIRENRRAGEKVIRVEVPGSYAYNVHERSVIEYASHVLAWVNAVEKAGIKIDLWVIQNDTGVALQRVKVKNTFDDGYTIENKTVPHRKMSVRVKKSDAPLNMARIAFAVASPASLRRIGFAVHERWCKDNGFRVSMGYAYPGSIGRSVPGVVRTPEIGGYRRDYKTEVAQAFRVGLGLSADGTEWQ